MGNEAEFQKANHYSLKCMRVTLIVLVIAWILNVLHIFIVDQTIMNNALIGVVIFVALGHVVKYILGFDKAVSNYIMIFLLVSMISFANMELAYHATLFMIFPMVCSVVYTEKKYKTFTFGLTVGDFFVSVIGGIYQNTKEMFQISEDITSHTLGFVKTMDVAVDSMHQIRETAEALRWWRIMYSSWRNSPRRQVIPFRS